MSQSEGKFTPLRESSANPRLYRSRLLLRQPGDLIEDGLLVVEDGKILAAGPRADVAAHWAGEATDLGEVILMPGLINAHCHLDFTVFRGALTPGKNFPDWIAKLNQLKRCLSDEEWVASICQGFDECRRWGTTTVLNIETFSELLVQLPAPPIRTWWFCELADLRNRFDTEEVVAGSLMFFEKHPNWLGGFGLSPHAPYTTSLPLYALARDCVAKFSMPWTTHLAESEEEWAMFANHQGPLFEYLQKLGRRMGDLRRLTPVQHLARSGAIPWGAILVHMNCVDEVDLTVLRQHVRQFFVVHCPNTHAYFDRREFPLELYRREGIPVLLGTDSCASNRELNLFSEMRTFARSFPQISPTEILEMVTTHPAKALDRATELGWLGRGAAADAIALNYDGSTDAAEAAIVHHLHPPVWTCINGRPATA